MDVPARVGANALDVWYQLANQTTAFRFKMEYCELELITVFKIAEHR